MFGSVWRLGCVIETFSPPASDTAVVVVIVVVVIVIVWSPCKREIQK